MRALVNEEGSITDTYSYTAYGELTARTGDTENHYLYTGEYYDGASGLYYLRARYMNPGTGSFISMDSYTGSIYDPASLHRYTYVKDNPVMYKDPSGYIAQSLGETSIATGIKGILDNIVQINALAILNGITNAFVSNLMGDSFSTQMKEFVKGFLCGFGLYSFAYFINAIYAISVLEILVVDVLVREAASAVMVVVSACDGDSSNVVKYEMQAAMYMLASVLLYKGTLPKNDMKPREVVSRDNSNSKYQKASAWERFTKRKANVNELLPNPLDEFSNSKIGPSDDAVAKYVYEISKTGKISEPIIVQKLSDGGYEIVNGHHRWLAALKTGLKNVPIKIKNFLN